MPKTERKACKHTDIYYSQNYQSITETLRTALTTQF